MSLVRRTLSFLASRSVSSKSPCSMLTAMTFTRFTSHLGLLGEEIVLGSVLDVPVVRSQFYRRRPLFLYDKTLAGASRPLNRRGFFRSRHRPRGRIFIPPGRGGCTPLSASAGFRTELVPDFPGRLRPRKTPRTGRTLTPATAFRRFELRDDKMTLGGRKLRLTPGARTTALEFERFPEQPPGHHEAVRLGHGR